VLLVEGSAQQKADSGAAMSEGEQATLQAKATLAPSPAPGSRAHSPRFDGRRRFALRERLSAAGRGICAAERCQRTATEPVSLGSSNTEATALEVKADSGAAMSEGEQATLQAKATLAPSPAPGSRAQLKGAKVKLPRDQLGSAQSSGEGE
jgi:hypothetical protein